LFKKTLEGYSLAETLISLALLSLIVIIYFNISALHYSQTCRDNLVKELFMEAHSMAAITEDKKIEDIPIHLFSPSNPTPFLFLVNTNHTVSMNMTEFATQFGLTIPSEITITNHNILCLLSPIIFGEIQFSQLTLYVFTTYNKKVLYGYATFIF
jgi:hypothetical protein